MGNDVARRRDRVPGTAGPVAVGRLPSLAKRIRLGGHLVFLAAMSTLNAVAPETFGRECMTALTSQEFCYPRGATSRHFTSRANVARANVRSRVSRSQDGGHAARCVSDASSDEGARG